MLTSKLNRLKKTSTLFGSVRGKTGNTAAPKIQDRQENIGSHGLLKQAHEWKPPQTAGPAQKNLNCN